MADDLDNSAPFNDDQGTKLSEDSSAMGSEATQHVDGQPHHERDREHESGYGGRGGHPKQPSDVPSSRR